MIRILIASYLVGRALKIIPKGFEGRVEIASGNLRMVYYAYNLTKPKNK